MKRNTRILPTLLSLLLIAASALTLFSCTEKTEDLPVTEKTVTVEVINKAGESVEHVLVTEQFTLADALKESGFVEGSDDTYGFYIRSVDGEVADYSADGSYWSLSQNGEMLMVGASDVILEDGAHYELTYAH